MKPTENYEQLLKRFNKRITQVDPEDKESRVVKKRFPLKVWHLMKASHERYLKRNDPVEVAKRRSRRRYRKTYGGNQNA